MKKTIIVLIIAITCTNYIYSQLSFDFETGLAFQSYNDVSIPNKDGTRFNFNEDFDIQGPVIPLRFRVGYSFAEKNHFFALYAPLSINYTGNSPKDIVFQQSIFAKGEFINGFYKFNSYRLTYRRDLLKNDKWIFAIGFTAKIRDASIKLSTNNLSDKKDDLGFVPLLHIFAGYSFEKFSVFIEGDGLAGGPGRAFDFFIGTKIPINKHINIKGGYRILEGGADVSTVYNFTMVQFINCGVILEF